ncbi:MAG: hypothetical protein K0S33_896 [Bacteroidetes bacterium]|jgi:uncharacterized protein (TIRG00374 family)|nr:hypothetical protein [Bacteroidota bacterium]
MPLSKKAKTLIQYVVFLAVGILLIWLVSRQVADKKEEILKAFKSADYFWVAISALTAILGHFLRAYRWNYLLEPLGHKAKLVNATGAVFIGYLANYGLPRVGELTRCTIVARYDNIPFEKALGTVITERIVDFFLLLLVFGLTLLFQFSELFGLVNEHIVSPLKSKLHIFIEKPVLGYIAIAVIVAGILGLWMLRKKIGRMLTGKFGSIIKGFGEGLTSVKTSRHKGMFTLLSLGIWTTYLLGIYFCFFAFAETAHLGLKEGLVLLLFGTFGVIFAPSGGLGAYQSILFVVLVFYSVSEVTSFALPWVIWSTQLLVTVLIGCISLIVLPIYNKNKNVAQ